MNFVPMAKNIRGHFGVPEFGLMTKMNARVQHFTHCD